MANDMDMWLDIQQLRHIGEEVQANDLENLYQAKFEDDEDPDTIEQMKQDYIDKYGSIDNYV